MEGTAHPKSRHACGRVAPWSARPRNAVPGNLGVVAGRRYYSPGIGRWSSRDPAEERRGGTNLHAFVRNAVTVRCDYLGMWPWTGCCNGLPYNRITHCCCRNVVASRLPVPTGVFSCKEPGLGGHRWLQIGGWAAGFYPSGSMWLSRGAVEIPDHHASTDPASDPRCEPVKRNPCHTDFSAFRLQVKLKALADSIECPYPSSSPSCGLIYTFPTYTCENYAFALAQHATVAASGGGKCTVAP
jgi:hypothetical protein